MRIIRTSLTCILLAVALAYSGCGGSDYQKHRNGVRVDTESGYLDVTVYTPTVIRVVITPERKGHVRESLAVIADPQKTRWQAETAEGDIILSTDSIRVRIDTSAGILTVYRTDGEIVTTALSERNNFEVVERDGDRGYTVRHHFLFSEDEAIYGLGQYQDGVMNWRGERLLLAQSNTMTVVPFLVSTKGYGILWNQTSKTIFNDDDEGAWFESEMADGVDFFITTGRSIDDAIGGYRTLTGDAVILPRWAYGFWQSKEHYRTQDELIGIAAEYRRRDVPLDAVVQDFMYWPSMEMWSGMVWDATRFPDPKRMVDKIRRQYNTRTVAVIWPSVGIETELYRELESINALYPMTHWAPARIYDAFNPEAREIYFRYANRGVLSTGIDGWWMDATEPEFRGTFDRYQTELSLKANGRCFLGSLTRYLNAYSLYTTAGISDMTREVNSEKRVVILTRSSFAGLQRYGAIVWSGDLYSSWGSLRNQIAAGVNYSMAGTPYWTSDIGGFTSVFRFPEGVKDPAFRELYVRWYQFGAFSPIFRSHGSNTPREIWQFGKPGSWEYGAIAHITGLRYRLLPYIYSVAWMTESKGYTMMRGLPMDFPGDIAVHSIDDHYMFGPSFLVNPVTRPMKHIPANPYESIPTRCWRGTEGDGMALTQTFYSGEAFDSVLVSRPTEMVNHTWRGNLPLEVEDRPYRMEYTGYLIPEQSGRHRFQLKALGGVRLWIGDENVIDRWISGEHHTEEFTLDLTEGERYAFRLEYLQPQPNVARLTLEWLTPSWEYYIYSGSSAWTTYLPAGKDWFDFWTGERYQGGETVSIERPIEQLPLFVPNGSIIPLGPVVSYADQPYDDPIEIRIYPGADAEFILYEDAGDGYAYRNGAYSTIRFSWNDAEETVTIGARTGEFPGMKNERTFTIVLVSENAGIGSETGTGSTVVHTGEPLQLIMSSM
jgi:alpha-D-xyloside xylohydrolase